MRIAVLGTGRMGSAIARRLAAEGFDVVVWNRSRDKADDVGVGFVADTPAAAVREADAVISSLTGPDAIRAVYHGSDGVLQAVDRKVVIEMSTAGPDVAADLAGGLKGHAGAALVEAPVLGSIGAAEKGELFILAGGDAADIARARPVLERLGHVIHVGPVGSGGRLKLVANSMLATCSGAAAELQAAGVAAGLDAEIVFSILERFVPYLVVRKPGYIEGRYQPVTFAVRDIVKDLALAMDMFPRVDADTPYTALSHRLYAEVAAEHADEEMSAINERFRRR